MDRDTSAGAIHGFPPRRRPPRVRPSLRRVCLPERCGLCRFLMGPFQEVFIVAVAEGDSDLPSEGFTYEQGTTDADKGEVYVPCTSACDGVDHYEVFGCHARCAHPLKAEEVKPLCHANSAKGDISPEQHQLREAWLRQESAHDFGVTLARRHPFVSSNDIWACIIIFYLQHLAVSRLYEMWTNVKARNFCVSFTQTVWVEYVFINNLPYVAMLSNQASDYDSKLLFQTNGNMVRGTLYIGEDHIGIRKIIFSANEYPPPILFPPGLWWKTLPLMESEYEPHFHAHGDGLKLRSLSTPYHEDTSNSTAWKLPMPHLRQPATVPLHPDAHGPFKMAAVPLNFPDVDGYSFRWRDGLQGIHAHRLTAHRAQIPWKMSADQDDVLTYMPIDAGEVITEIWKIQARADSKSTLWIKTNKKRNTFVGPYVDFNNVEYESSEQLYKDDQGWPRMMFYDQSPASSRAIAFQESQASPALQIGRSEEYCYSTLFDDAVFTGVDSFNTFAVLKDVTTITPSFRRVGTRGSIGGLLLEYASGRRAALGQYQIDNIGQPVAVQGSGKLWIALDTANNGPCRVVGCYAGNSPRIGPDLKALEIGSQGLLEWRIAGDGTLVRYNEGDHSLFYPYH